MRTRSILRPGRLIPATAAGLRSRSVRLKPGACMDWHSTARREELLILLGGWVDVELRNASGRVRRIGLRRGRCLFIPRQTWHRVVNHSRGTAHYLYVTGTASGTRG